MGSWTAPVETWTDLYLQTPEGRAAAIEAMGVAEAEIESLRTAAQAVIDDALADDASRGLFTVDADKLTELASALDGRRE